MRTVTFLVRAFLVRTFLIRTLLVRTILVRIFLVAPSKISLEALDWNQTHLESLIVGTVSLLLGFSLDGNIVVILMAIVPGIANVDASRRR